MALPQAAAWAQQAGSGGETEPGKKKEVERDGPWYGSFGGGYQVTQRQNVQRSDQTDLEIELDGGYNVNLALGYAFSDPGFRTELQFLYLNHAANRFISLNGRDTIQKATGDLEGYAFMGNAYFDLGLYETDFGLFSPYIGVGLGMMNMGWEDLQSEIFIGTAPGKPNTNRIISDSQYVFAYQFMAGIGFPLSRRTSLDMGYRFLGSEDVALKDDYGRLYEGEGLRSHAINATVRVRF